MSWETATRPPRVRFSDFELRAWRADARHVEVLVHASPVGSMSRPVRVPFDRRQQRRTQIDATSPTARMFAAGRRLAGALLPAPVYGLLQAALREVARQDGGGLRLRLVLDEELSELPWEFLYRPDAGHDAHAGFFASDPMIAIVRGAPRTGTTVRGGTPPARLVFTGALWDGRDGWDTKGEFRELKALTSRSQPAMDVGRFIDAADERALLRALARGADIFHYTGHIDGGRDAVLTRSVNAEGTAITASWPIAEVARRLAEAGTRFAIFNGCNSSRSAFVAPLIAHGLSAFVCVTGIVYSDAALAFSSRLYEGLLVGLSIDEAVTHARLHLLRICADTGRSDWGTYVVYMQSRESVLFPADESQTAAASQRVARAERQTTISHVRELMQRLDGDDYGRLLSDLAARGVLLLGRFSEPRLVVLRALKQALTIHPAGYLPVLFTFARPKERDLVESIASFAGLSRFIIADLTDPAMVREELLKIVPAQPSVPVVPIIERGHKPYTGFSHIQRYPWVTPVVEYRDSADLVARLEATVIRRAEETLTKQTVR